MSESRKICIVFEYDGSAYHGWQRQSNAVSIQQVIEEAINRTTKEEVRIVASGRTDAGVHALGQVATFLTDSKLEPEVFSRALNAALPRDIRVLSSLVVNPEFHPQYSSKGKKYLYIILNREGPSALLTNRCWHISRKLDVKEMIKASSFLIGRHDFSSFQSSSCSARNPVRSVTSLEILDKEPFVELRFEGNGFLKNMVRNIVGTLVEVGQGLYPSERMKEILEARDRRVAGRCAPPCGLYLVSVRY